MQNKIEWIDMMNRAVVVPSKPVLRIVSLVPSQTELLYDLGLGKQVIGQTLFCVHPKEEFSAAVKVGGTKKIDMVKILQLNPDIIIGNKEENDQQQIEELSKHFPVWMSDIKSQDDNIRMITELGQVFNAIGAASYVKQRILTGFALLNAKIHSTISCVYLIWNNPIMTSGSDTFINEMLGAAGFENAITDDRYPEISLEYITELNPEVLLLSSEPFPFKQKHVEEFSKLLPNTKVLLVDGEFFSWYGSRIALAPAYFYELNQEILQHA